jgi:hypothetical protein
VLNQPQCFGLLAHLSPPMPCIASVARINKTN